MKKQVKALTILSTTMVITGCSTGSVTQQTNETENIKNNIDISSAKVENSAEPEKLLTYNSDIMITKQNPNIVIIALDDMGFSDFGCFGAEINTPNIDKLAQNGLRYNNFHVTPMSSPSRAALLTGRNPHSVGVGRLTNFNTGKANSCGKIPESAAFIPEILNEVGYNTFGTGKWHVAAGWELTSNGPYDTWPLGKGFEQYYGFTDGNTDQFYPQLIHDNHRVYAEYNDNYHLTTDLTDHAIQYIRDQKNISKNKPFMLYYTPGAMHFPIQVPEEYKERYEGVYDVGWDVIRKQRFEKQKELGIIPLDAELAPYNEGVVPWDTLNEDEKRLFIEYQKTYAGFMEHTDEQIGRLIDSIEEMGELDNTVIFLTADNGASGQGGSFGTMNAVKTDNGISSTVEKDIQYIDQLGDMTALYPSGWAQVSCTPFRYYKLSPNHLGGIRVPLIISYPDGIEKSQNGGIREQFGFITDISATIYDILGITPPEVFDGVKQMDMHGVSLLESFNNPDSKSKRTTQYFELFGNRGLYHEGWFIGSNHTKGEDFSKDTWNLYDLNKDYSQLHDISEENPEKLEELLKIWSEQAELYGVNPLDDESHVEMVLTQIMKDMDKYKHFKLYPYTSSINADSTLHMTALNRSHTISTELERNSKKEEGVLLAYGNQSGGYSLYIMNNRLCYEYCYDNVSTIIESDIEIPMGIVKLEMRYKKEGPLNGTATLFINEQQAGSVYIPQVYPLVSNIMDGMSVGFDAQRIVSERYKNINGGFKYTGDLEYITIDSENDYTPPKELLAK